MRQHSHCHRAYFQCARFQCAATCLFAPTHPRFCRPGPCLFFCRSLERLCAVPAGNVLALSGLETTILKSATLSSSPACLPLAPMTFQAAPIVRVALEPSCPTDMAALTQGLKLLNR